TGIGAVVIVTVLIALVALSAYPAPNGTTELGTTWLRAPLMGVVYSLGPHVAFWVERALRVYVGLTGALILLVAAATSNSGFRRRRGAGLLEHVEPVEEGELPQAEFSKILVPMKLGEIGEEMVATAVKLAQERGAAVVALHVIRVPLDQPLDAELFDQEERAAASLAEAAALGADLGVTVEGKSIRARSIGEAIVKAAEETGADLIVLGSSPRWRRQSRFFSPTVDYVLRKAPAEVLVVAFPQGVLEEV